MWFQVLFTRIFKTIPLLISLSWCVYSQDLPKPKNIPVNILDLDYVVIDGYHGVMDTKTMELFSNVETLSLKNCNFTVLHENFIHPLKNLQKLILANSHYSRVKNDVSICCKKLREIEFYSSNIDPLTEEEFKKFAAMKNLERIHLHRMDVPVLRANVLVGSNLKNLEIEYTNLASIEDGALNGMDKLEVLNLQNDKLKSVPTASLAAVKTLKQLNLKGNLLEKITTDDFPLLPNLEELNLGHNPIKEINLKGLKEKLPNIKKVDVSGIDIDPSKAEGVPLIKVQIA